MDSVQSLIDAEKSVLTSSNVNYNEAQSVISANKERLKSLDLEQQVLKMEIEKFQKTLNDYSEALYRLIKENPWVLEHKQ